MMLPSGQIWLAVEPVDMRRGIEGLSLLLQESLGRAPADGSAYAFRNRRGTRLKLLVWDGTGTQGLPSIKTLWCKAQGYSSSSSASTR